MKKTFYIIVLLSLGLALGAASAQTVNPNQIRPSTTNGQVLTTVSGVTTWAAAMGGNVSLPFPGIVYATSANGGTVASPAQVAILLQAAMGCTVAGSTYSPQSNSCISSGSGTITPSPQGQVSYYSGSGTASTLTGASNITTDGDSTLTVGDTASAHMVITPGSIVNTAFDPIWSLDNTNGLQFQGSSNNTYGPNGVLINTGAVQLALVTNAPSLATDSAGNIVAGSASTGTVTSVTSANANLTVATGTTTPVLTVVAAPKLATARTINGVSFDGTANITVPGSSATSIAGDVTGTLAATTVVQAQGGGIVFPSLSSGRAQANFKLGSNVFYFSPDDEGTFQLMLWSINRDPNTGTYADPTKAAAGINVSSASGNGSVSINTSNTNGSNPFQFNFVFDKDGYFTAPTAVVTPSITTSNITSPSGVTLNISAGAGANISPLSPFVAQNLVDIEPLCTATSSANCNSNNFNLTAGYWNGTIAKRVASFESLVPASGTNPLVTATYDIGDSSSAFTGTAQFQFLKPVVAPIYQETLTTPASSTATCTAGQFTDDANFHYVCVSANTWKRAALVTF